MKSEAVVFDLRRRIVSGEFPAGTQLPLRQDLISQYKVSTVVFQKCVNQLIAEGFLESRGVKGTWVTPYPPHLFRVGILVPAPASEKRSWDSCWRAFELSIARMQNNVHHHSFEFYYNITDNTILDQDEEWKRLVQDIELHRLSGLIVLCNLFKPEILNVLEHVPTIFFGEHEYLSPNLFSVDFDYYHQMDMALSLLKERGCRNIAVLLNTEFDHKFYHETERLFSCHGLRFRPAWLQAFCLCPDTKVWMGQGIRLLFDRENHRIPDGLVVMNENFLYPLLAALEEMNIEVGKDLQIAAHGNLPRECNEFHRVHRVWIDCSRLLTMALEMLRDSREQGWTTLHRPRVVPNALKVEQARGPLPAGNPVPVAPVPV